jgi:exodeoxyribonuclease V alpha subunit
MSSRDQALQLSDTPLLPGLALSPKGNGDLQGTVEKVLFADVDSGFMILRVKTEDGTVVAVRGKGDPASVGDQIVAKGSWVADPKWGRQFKASVIRAEIPESTAGIVRYLGSGNINGIGLRTAEKLRAHFGDRLPEVMTAPSTLVAAGIPERKAQAIADHWLLRTRYARLLSLLYAHNLGTGLAQKIIQQYGDATMRVVLQTPYRLSKDVHGIGFKIADRIALSQNLPKDSPDRIRAAIVHQIGDFTRDGHCAVGRSTLIQEVSKLLLLPTGKIEAELDALIAEEELVQEKIGDRSAIYDNATYKCEVEVAEEISRRIVTNPVPSDVDRIIAEASARLGIQLHEHQAEAVRTAIENSFMVITGNPGTGKTSTMQTLMECMRAINPKIRISLAAPTGRAAKRLSESTGVDASTLHRLLAWSAETRGFTRNRETPLELDMLIVDEGSMIDIWMMRDLLRALPDEARLVIVGDSDQLPSVGPGNVLYDMIESGIVPVVRLTHIFRQGAGSNIATAARQINMKNMPTTTKPNTKSDMWGIYVDSPEETLEKVKRAVVEVTRHMKYDPLRDIQVLTPGHQNETGTVRLNAVLQETLNRVQPGERVVRHKDREFRVRDRVIQVTNNYDNEVFNGDIGNIVAIHDFVDADGDGEVVVVDYDGHQVNYRKSDLDQIQLAYAITIHKSQGSEFPVVIVVLTTQHYVMLRKSLVYTGVSRAKKLCAIIGSMRAVKIAVQSDTGGRLTGLSQRLVANSFARDWNEAADDIAP